MSKADTGAAPRKRGQPETLTLPETMTEVPPAGKALAMCTIAEVTALIESLLEAHAAGVPQLPKYLDSSGMCQMLQISAPTLRGLVASGLPHVRCGEAIRYPLDAVTAWLASRNDGTK